MMKARILTWLTKKDQKRTERRDEGIYVVRQPTIPSLPMH